MRELDSYDSGGDRLDRYGASTRAQSTRHGDVAVVVLTHNRVHLLPKCVDNVLRRTSEATREIVIWNNASTDETAVYLDSLDDPRITVVHSERNIGQNAYAEAFRLTSAPYLVELDDDVVDAPRGMGRTRCSTRSCASRRSAFWRPTSRTTLTTRRRTFAITYGPTSTRSSRRTASGSSEALQGADVP